MPRIDYRSEIDRIAGPPSAGETQERRINLAATRLKLPFRTVKGLYYGERTDPKTSVHLRFEELACDPLQALAARLSAIEAMKGGAR